MKMKYQSNKMLYIFALIALISFSICAQYTEYEDIPITRDEMVRRAELKYIQNSTLETERFYDDHIIHNYETIDGNITVVRGNLTIRGQVEGDVVVIYGDVFIESNAEIMGNITSIGGKIDQVESSVVKGNQIETNPRNVFRNTWYSTKNQFNYDNDYYDSWHYSYQYQYSTLPLWPLEDQFLVRYNRVQGLFLGLEFPKSIANKYKILSLHGFGGYGFEEKAWRYQIGIDRYFFNRTSYRFEIGANVHDLTDTRDDWLITPLENSLASFLIHEDFQDFYHRHGYEIHISQNLSIYLKGTLAYRNDNYNSVKKNVDWALFGGDKKFRHNPAIEKGNMRSLYGELYLDTRNNHEIPRRGWYGKLSMEMSNSDLRSDFYFNQYIFELRKYVPISRNERLDLRFKVGSSEGDLPIQKLYELGGISTLRGFEYKEFAGNRLLLTNIEYNLSPSIFSRDFFLFDDIRLIFFSDIGTAWFSNDNSNFTKGFDTLKFNSLKSDIGVAFSNWDGTVRLNIAKRTDTNKDPMVLTFRIAKPF
jgi:cytoskeletal protein CcmA (bactofilin family)